MSWNVCFMIRVPSLLEFTFDVEFLPWIMMTGPPFIALLIQNRWPLNGVSTGETRIYDNIIVGQARIMTGDVGVEYRHQLARRITIAHNKFGQDVRIMTGNVGPEASKEFMSNFCK